jgi:hypothetical protein
VTAEELVQHADEAGLDPAALAAVFRLESGGSGATGLIQFMPKTARGLGVTMDQLREMSAAEQLPYVMRYFKNAGLTEQSQPDDYFVAVAAPGFVGRPDDDVVYARGTAAWEQNRPWRPAGGGDITVGSIKAAYRRRAGK